MMTEHYGLILDSLIVVLLLATIFYCVVLNRRLGRLRNSRTELERATRAFAEAAARADAGIKGLRHTAEESGAGLQQEVKRAQGLREEMHMLVDAAESLAKRLESAAGSARAASGAQASSSTQTASRPQRPRAEAGSGNRPDRDLLKAIENMR